MFTVSLVSKRKLLTGSCFFAFPSFLIHLILFKAPEHSMMRVMKNKREGEREKEGQMGNHGFRTEVKAFFFLIEILP